MKYFIDTEFLEGPQDKKFLGFKVGETKPTIDLISIGIVSEDGNQYYAISKDFNLREAWNRWQPRTGQGDRNISDSKEYWIRENILKPIFKDLWYEKCHMQNLHHVTNDFTYKNFESLVSIYGKSNKDIAYDIFCFIHRKTIIDYDDKINFADTIVEQAYRCGCKTEHEFYAYYGDYDWVAFCWLFGKMIDLPKGFPMYCRDLKQMLDECYVYQANKYPDLSRLEAWLKDVKKHPEYPVQLNEHSAIADAHWNKNLYNFIQYLKNGTVKAIPVSDGINKS